tara:strand:+ start:1697 stop:2416 length:720 start_codon:yes stop_codon:yes gene_type:complete
MKTIALSTARKGSKSVPNKNVMMVDGHPLFAHNIMASNSCSAIQKTFCSTDDEKIKNLSSKYSFDIIDRPEKLSGDDSSHLETIRHGILEIERQMGRIDVCVILLGNSAGTTSEDLENSIDMLEGYDSVVSVSKFNMFNPTRAWEINDKDELKTILSQEDLHKKTSGKLSNDKNSIGDVYFFNGNFQVIKRDIIFKDDNDLPFPWLGKKIRPAIQDVFMELDAKWQIPLVKNEKRNNHD